MKPSSYPHCNLLAQGKPGFVGRLSEHEHCSGKKLTIKVFYAARIRRSLSNNVPENSFFVLFFYFRRSVMSLGAQPGNRYTVRHFDVSGAASVNCDLYFFCMGALCLKAAAVVYVVTAVVASNKTFVIVLLLSVLIILSVSGVKGRAFAVFWRTPRGAPVRWRQRCTQPPRFKSLMCYHRKLFFCFLGTLSCGWVKSNILVRTIESRGSYFALR